MGTTFAILRTSGNKPVDKKVFIILAIIGDNKKEIRLPTLMNILNKIWYAKYIRCFRFKRHNGR